MGREQGIYRGGRVELAPRRKRRSLRLCGLFAIAACAYGGLAAPSLAAKTHPFLATFGSFSEAGSVAVDQSSGDVYVLDVGASAVQRFDAAGNPVEFASLGSNILTGAATPNGAFAFDTTTGSQVAVDNSGGPNEGDIYVASSAEGGFVGVIDIFAPTGAYLGQLTTANGNPFGESCGVTVDASGDVYVGEFSGNVDQYVPSGSPASDADYHAQITGLSQSCNLAVDSTGAVYVGTYGGGSVTKYPASAFGQFAPAGTVIDPAGTGIAVDQTTDEIYVDERTKIAQYGANGALLGTSGAERLTSSAGVAINESSGNLYASDSEAVSIFGPVPPPPVATVGAVTDVTGTSATLHGTVDPRGLSGVVFRFVVSGADSAYTAVTPEAALPPGAGAIPVSVAVSGLPAGATLNARLVAVAGSVEASSDTTSFQTSALPVYVPPAPPGTVASPYGCAAPHLHAVNVHPRPGGTVTLTGSDLGVGGTLALGSTPSLSTSWSPAAITFTVPASATGTLSVTVNCGTVSNTVGLTIASPPSSSFTITKSSIKRMAATISVKLPGPGQLQISGKNAASVAKRITKAGTVNVMVRLTRAGEKALSRSKSRKLGVNLRLQFTPTGGSAAVRTKAETFTRKPAK
jgi:hypothetical protein